MPPVKLQASFGAKRRVAQLATWKGSLEVATGRPGRRAIVRVDRERVAVGRVEREVRAIEVDLDRAQPQRDPFEDLRQRIGDRGDLGGRRVDVERRPDDDVAEVVRAGDRRGDHGEAERRAFVGAGEVDLARDVDRVGAGAGAGRRGADLGGGRAARARLLGEARVARSRRAAPGPPPGSRGRPPGSRRSPAAW